MTHTQPPEVPQPTSGFNSIQEQPKPPMVSKLWGWAAVVGNAVVGAAEMISSEISAMSVAGDGLHNIGEALPYGLQVNNVNRQGQAKGAGRREQLHKLGFWTLSLTSAAGMVKAGIDLGTNHETAANNAAIYASGASVALNCVLYPHLHKGEKQRKGLKTVFEQALSTHFKFDVASSVMALGGALMHKYGLVDTEQAIGIASGAFGAWLFRPTTRNMSGTSYGHGHH